MNYFLLKKSFKDSLFFEDFTFFNQIINLKHFFNWFLISYWEILVEIHEMNECNQKFKFLNF
jgi:hypothetical protein